MSQEEIDFEEIEQSEQEGEIVNEGEVSLDDGDYESELDVGQF